VEEVKTGAQVPLLGVTMETHPQAFLSGYKPRMEHKDQYWMHGWVLEQLDDVGADADADVDADQVVAAGAPAASADDAAVAAAAATDDDDDDDNDDDDDLHSLELEDDESFGVEIDVPSHNEHVVSLQQARDHIRAYGATEGTTPFLLLNIGGRKGVQWHEFVVYDIMHAGAGVIKDTFLGTLYGTRWSEKVANAERNMASRRFTDAQLVKGPACLTEAAKQLFENALSTIGRALGGDAARLVRLCDPSKSSKSHTEFLLAGPIGLYALACVRRHLPDTVYQTLVRLLQAIHLLNAKEIHVASLPTLKAFVYEAVCAVELYLPVSERDIKLHELTEMVTSIECWGEWNNCCNPTHDYACMLCETVIVFSCLRYSLRSIAQENWSSA